jgi:protein involved in polysaccharide export with SLBB domain
MRIKSVGEELSYWVAVCGLVLGVLCLAGCRTQSPQQEFAELPPGIAATSAPSPGAATTITTPTPASTTTAPGAPAAAPIVSPVAVPAVTNFGRLEPEVLRAGDSLTITFTDLTVPMPPFEEKIREDGTITLPLNLTFKADGKTLGGLEKEIRARYVPDYFKQMTVTVKQQDSTRWYYVDGEVRLPNRQMYISRITVLKAIATAGGFTDFANKKKVKLTRLDGRTQIVNCPKALDNPSLDPEVYPGDKIHVPRRLW